MNSTVNFFVAEDRAKKATIALLLLYVLGIAVVILVTDVAWSAAIAAYYGYQLPIRFGKLIIILLPWIGGFISLNVIVATIRKSLQLRSGGNAFRKMLGGRWLTDHVRKPAERRLKNVVEEMAIAAGVKVPQICVLENEPGINAFAAGLNNKDAVIGVTKGCLDELNRDELQAVIGHEFSHILYNDTTLNGRTYAAIFGLMSIYLMGFGLVNAIYKPRNDPARNSGGMMMCMVTGSLLVGFGWLGCAVGRIIRASIVRQREFLADSSAVQYTRNPDALASALYKMADCGSHLKHSAGEEAEHFLFGPGTASKWSRSSLTRTHPKTIDRINAVQPKFHPSNMIDVPPDDLIEDSDGYGSRIRPVSD